MRKLWMILVVLAMTATFLASPVMAPTVVEAMDDSNHSVTADTDGTAITFTIRCTSTWVKNDGLVSVYVKWYKAGEAIPATESTGGLELKPGEYFVRDSSRGGLEFIGMTVRSASSTAAVRAWGGIS